MLPVIHLFGISVPTYPVMGGIACAVFWLMFTKALRRDIRGRIRFILPPAVIISALIGARLPHAAVNPNRYGANYPIWKLSYERMYLMGGIILGMAVLYILCQELDLPFLRISDDLTFGAGMAMVILKAGCFLNGCCGGKPSGRFGVVFPARSAIYDILNTSSELRKVLPVQLFECIAYLIGVIVLLVIVRKYKLPEGCRFLIYAVYVSMVRLILHPLRETTYPDIWNMVYPVLYIIILAFSAGLVIRLLYRHKKV